MIEARSFIDAALARGYRWYSGVPCSFLTPFIDEAIADPRLRHLPAPNEGDAVALAAIAARISEFGFTPNRVAALGENLLLLVNLAVSAWFYARFLRRQGPFVALERWQVAYLPVFSAWAAVVVIAFPPLFNYR